MKTNPLHRARLTLALAACALLAAGCAAAAAGAGAAAAIHMTGNSAQSQVQGTLAQVDARAQAVLAEMGVQVESRTETPGAVEYRGSREGLNIGMEIETVEGGLTQVTASARVSPVEWDNDYARELVRRVVERS